MGCRATLESLLIPILGFYLVILILTINRLPEISVYSAADDMRLLETNNSTPLQCRKVYQVQHIDLRSPSTFVQLRFPP